MQAGKVHSSITNVQWYCLHLQWKKRRVPSDYYLMETQYQDTERKEKHSVDITIADVKMKTNAGIYESMWKILKRLSLLFTDTCVFISLFVMTPCHELVCQCILNLPCWQPSWVWHHVDLHEGTNISTEHNAAGTYQHVHTIHNPEDHLNITYSSLCNKNSQKNGIVE